MQRDIKSLNVLVTEGYSCKLTDFGCSKLISDRDYINTLNSGTPLWMAPEVKCGQYNFSADVYSLGLVLFELFEKQLPTFNQYTQSVVLPPNYQSASIIRPCIYPIPEQRPPAAKVVIVLDQLLTHTLKGLHKLLPKSEQELLTRDIPQLSDQSDLQETELESLYHYLLENKSFNELEVLISKAFIPNNSPPTANIQPIAHHPSSPQVPYNISPQILPQSQTIGNYPPGYTPYPLGQVPPIPMRMPPYQVPTYPRPPYSVPQTTFGTPPYY